MRVAALYDVHGNLPALEAVLAEVRVAGPDLVVVGGDVVPGPMPRACLDLLASLDVPVRWIRGNGEREVLAARAGAVSTALPEAVRGPIRWVAEALDPHWVREMESWPLTTRIETDVWDGVLFCHATPRSDEELFTRLTREERLAAAFAGVRERLVVCGHTHMQLDREVGSCRVVNAGSVGMPFGEPGAYWLLLDDRVHLRRTEYDRVDAARRIARTEYPGAAEHAERYVLRPPTEDEMLRAFGEAGGG